MRFLPSLFFPSMCHSCLPSSFSSRSSLALLRLSHQGAVLALLLFLIKMRLSITRLFFQGAVLPLPPLSQQDTNLALPLLSHQSTTLSLPPLSHQTVYNTRNIHCKTCAPSSRSCCLLSLLQRTQPSVELLSF